MNGKGVDWIHCQRLVLDFELDGPVWIIYKRLTFSLWALIWASNVLINVLALNLPL